MTAVERDLSWEEIDALIGDVDDDEAPPSPAGSRESGTFATGAERGTPKPRVYLRTEQVTIDRSGGFGAMMETIDAPVIELFFDYGAQRISACDARDRFFKTAGGGMRVVHRDAGAETRARCVLESFGAVDLECLDDYAVPPGSRAHYLLRCDGDVHDYCGFSS